LCCTVGQTVLTKITTQQKACIMTTEESITRAERILRKRGQLSGYVSYQQVTVPRLRQHCGNNAARFDTYNRRIVQAARQVPSYRIQYFFENNVPRLLLTVPELEQFSLALDRLVGDLKRSGKNRTMMSYPGAPFGHRRPKSTKRVGKQN